MIFSWKSKGVAQLAAAIEDASRPVPGNIVRWRDLRLLRGPFDLKAPGDERWAGLRLLRGELGDRQLMIPLPNDGTLSQQMAGMMRWTHAFAHKNRVSLAEASALALAYTARQLSGCNRLLNAQTPESKAEEAAMLRILADRLLAPEGEGDMAAIFHRVSDILCGRGAGDPLGPCLEASRAAFYVETGFSALYWTMRGLDLWALDVAETYRISVDAVKEEASLSACRLAANAYHNNAATLFRWAPKTLASFSDGSIQPGMLRTLYDDFYPESLALARGSAPSYDAGPKRPGWPLIIRPAARDIPFAAYF